MSYFCGLPIDEVKKICDLHDDKFNHSLAAFRFARLANGGALGARKLSNATVHANGSVHRVHELASEAGPACGLAGIVVEAPYVAPDT